MKTSTPAECKALGYTVSMSGFKKKGVLDAAMLKAEITRLERANVPHAVVESINTYDLWSLPAQPKTTKASRHAECASSLIAVRNRRSPGVRLGRFRQG